MDFVQFLYEQLTVFRIHDGLYRSTEYAGIVFFEYTCLVKSYTAVQGCLSTERQQHTVGTFLGDDFLYEIRSDGQEVNFVGHTFRGLHGGDVRVDQDGFDTFFLQGFQGL